MKSEFVIEDTGMREYGKIIYRIGFKCDGAWLQGWLEVNEADLWDAMQGKKVYQRREPLSDEGKQIILDKVRNLFPKN